MTGSLSMPRKKVNLQLIAHHSARRATLKKRRASLMKKAGELSTLCGMDACVVVYGEGAPQPEVWPPSPEEAVRILERFRAIPETEKCKKMLDMEGFLKQRVATLQLQLQKARRDNDQRETALLLHDAMAGRRPNALAGLSAEELNNLSSMVEARLKSVKDGLQRLREQGLGNPATALQLPSAPLAPMVTDTAGAGNAEVQAPNLQDWLFDVVNAGGSIGWSGSFGGGIDGAGTGASEVDMHQLGNASAGLPWAGHGPSIHPM